MATALAACMAGEVAQKARVVPAVRSSAETHIMFEPLHLYLLTSSGKKTPFLQRKKE